MSDSYERSFRFYDNREKYLLFVSTCGEKQEIARRIAMDIKGLQPVRQPYASLMLVWATPPFSHV